MPEDYDEYEQDPDFDEDDFDDVDDVHDDSGCPDASANYAQSDPSSESFLIDGVGFANPGGNSALRAATKKNPRNLPCGTCKRPNMLTPADKRKGYQCDGCADRDEGGWEY